MESYEVYFTIKAKEDLKDLVRYIKSELLEPAIALKYAQMIKHEIEKLEYLPKRFSTIGIEFEECKNIRKLVVKNYIVFYQIYENEKTVKIIRILYGGTEWKNKLL